MAQDFGDDIGEMLFTGFKRSLERAIYDFWRESRNNNRDEEWYRNKFMKEGMSEEDAEAAAKDMAARKQACVPFGDKNDAAYFAKFVKRTAFSSLPSRIPMERAMSGSPRTTASLSAVA